MHYYFSDANLAGDGFMRSKLAEAEGWVRLDLLNGFNRMKKMGLNTHELAALLREASTELEVEGDGQCVRRRVSWAGGA